MCFIIIKVLLYLHVNMTFTGHQMNSFRDGYPKLQDSSKGIRFYEYGMLEVKQH